MATSGTVNQTKYSQIQIIEHAARRAGYNPEKFSAEAMIVARETLFTLLGEMTNAGWPLWTQEFNLLGMTLNGAEVNTPDGTIDLLHAYWRILQPWRGAAALSTGADGSVLFAGAPNSDVTITGPNPAVSVNFTTAMSIDTVGVLAGGSVSTTAALELQTSSDGVTYTTFQTLPSTAFAPGNWSYFRIDPLPTAQYMRLLNPTSGSWVLNQLNFGLAQSQDIELGLMSIDDYYNLPNRSFSSTQVVQAYIDRQLTPLLRIWPIPNTTAFYNGTITAVMRRYIQDPGAFSNDIELPQRWYEATVWRLASRLVDEIPESMSGLESSGYSAFALVQMKIQLIQRCEKAAARSEALAWAEERTRGPIRLTPNVSCYTR